MKRSTIWTVFFCGSVFGFVLCFVMQQQSPITFAWLVPAMVFCVAIWFLIWAEEWTHAERLARWEIIRRRGKWFFIVSRYVLLRGLVLIIVYAAPAYFSPGLHAVALVSLLVLIVTLILGHQEWTDCENQYRIDTLRKSAVILKAIQN